MKKILLPILMIGLFAFAGCSNDQVTGPNAQAEGDIAESEFPVSEEFPGIETEFMAKSQATNDLVDTAIGAGFNTLVAAVQAAELEGALRGEGPFTVFAPTDEAFAKLPSDLLNALLLPENQDKLQEILLYHVVNGAVKSRDLRFYQSVETLQGNDLEIFRFWRLVVVNRNPVAIADVGASNGVIHVINNVLIPPGFTLDRPAEPELDLVDTAVAAGLNTLVAAVGAAGLEDALRNDEGKLTVFAPTEEAFAALPEGLVAELLLPENVELLQTLLLYHVVDGQVLSTDLQRFQRVEMLSGQKSWIFKTRSGKVYVNLSRVIAADNLATNGVAHVINRVLIPPTFYGLLSSLPDEAPDYSPKEELLQQ